MKQSFFLLFAICLSHLSVAQYSLESVFSIPGTPVDLTNDGTEKLYVVALQGQIYIYDPQVGVLEEPFLDIPVKFGGERGLLGLAFHPDYANNGFFFVNYTRGESREETAVSRFSRDESNPNKADDTTEEEFISYPQPKTNHNGGQLFFGTDGFLYISSGDGGGGGDEFMNGQDTNTPLGAILRIDVDQEGMENPYSIPDDNPFAQNPVEDDSTAREIFAYGLRNPWRMSQDPETGLIWAADVGQNAFEEIDIIENGGNYGWPIMEGFSCFQASSCDMTDLALPVFDYAHPAGGDGRSVTGGYIYRGSEIPELVGKYIFGDFLTGEIWALTYDAQNNSADVELLLDTELGITSFGLDNLGELYVCAADNNIYRLKFTGPTGVRDEFQSLDFSIYPNPTSSVLNVRLQGFLESRVGVYDVNGQLVFEKPLSRESQLDVSNLKQGIYFLKISNKNKVAFERFVKH